MALNLGRSRLPYWRKLRGLTQLDVAEFLGVTQPFISGVENGKEVLSYEMAANVAELLKIDMKELHDWTYTPGPLKSKRL